MTIADIKIEPRLLNRKEAAAYCGVSEAAFTVHIVPHIRPVHIGKKLLWDRKPSIFGSMGDRVDLRCRNQIGWNASNDDHSYQRVEGGSVKGPHLLLPSANDDTPAG